jgi:hypothetical protein
MLAALALLAATPAAATTFDGTWTVHVVTKKGSCEDSYSYPLRISNGGVAGEAPVTISGRVGDDGAISVTVGSGYQRASGSGRLSGMTGSGTWRGGLCSGTWTAQRL